MSIIYLSNESNVQNSRYSMISYFEKNKVRKDMVQVADSRCLLESGIRKGMVVCRISSINAYFFKLLKFEINLNLQEKVPK